MSSKILVVDDEACILKMMELVLKGAGYEVITATSGRDGLDLFGNGAAYDVVVVDYKMPGLNGLEVEHEILKRDPSTRVIIVSGFGGIETALEAMNRGATDFLRKPFAPEALRDAVRSALERKGKMSPVSTVCREFSKQNINGYSFELSEEILDDPYGDITCVFEVVRDSDLPRKVKVVMPAYVQELVKAYIDSDSVPCGQRFFQALCEEKLASTLRQTGVVPSSGLIRIEDLGEVEQKWIDSMMTIALVD